MSLPQPDLVLHVDSPRDSDLGTPPDTELDRGPRRIKNQPTILEFDLGIGICSESQCQRLLELLLEILMSAKPLPNWLARLCQVSLIGLSSMCRR